MITVTHNPAAARFEASVDGLLSVADYALRGSVMTLHHTFVPTALRGRGVADPLAATARNFLRAVPLALALSLVFATRAHADARGVALAVASGALTSGLGYVVWYAALGRLSALRAATVQLSVPLLAAFGGVLFLSEAITPRLALASVAILGGIALVLSQKSRQAARR
eukprot:Opistho-1_new@6177